MTELTRIEVRELIVPLHIGVSDEERSFPQPIEIDFSVEFSRNSHNDDLLSTIDYSRSMDRVVRLAQRAERLLLESLAEEIAVELLEDSSVFKAVVTVRKRRPPVPYVVRDVGVIVERSRP